MGKPGKHSDDVRNRKHKSTPRARGINAPPRPVKDPPFEVDVSDDGDIATPKPELSEDELKEQEDRRS